MDCNIKKSYGDIVISHYVNNWGGNYKIIRLNEGKMFKMFPEFCVLEFPPTATRNMWTYATCNMSTFENANPIELHIFSLAANPFVAEILTAVSYFHKTEAKLNLNHTVNFGVPWQMNSNCSYGLISLPYLDGPKLEILEVEKDKSISFYWLIPITPEELAFKKLNSVEQLEERFEESKFNFLDVDRESVV